MTPTIFFNLVLGVIAALKVFAVAFVGTNGGPNYATWFFILHLYQSAFQNFEMGYASALAWIFFVLVVVADLLQRALLAALGLLRGGGARVSTQRADPHHRTAATPGDAADARRVGRAESCSTSSPSWRARSSWRRSSSPSAAR